MLHVVVFFVFSQKQISFVFAARLCEGCWDIFVPPPPPPKEKNGNAGTATTRNLTISLWLVFV